MMEAVRVLHAQELAKSSDEPRRPSMRNPHTLTAPFPDQLITT